jgi:signal transduction histidine kinase
MTGAPPANSANSAVPVSAKLLTIPTLVALVATEAGGVAEAWARGEKSELVLVSCAATAFAAAAVASADRGRPALARALAFAQLPFGVLLASLSHATVLVGLFPLVGVFEMTWPIKGSVAAVGTFLIAMIAVGALGKSPAGEILARCGGFVGGAVFTIAFTRVAIAERRARGELERLFCANQEANTKLRAYATMASELSAAEERNRIARDIHDGVAHGLTVIHVQLEAARAVSGDESRAAELRACVDRAQEAAKDALADVRRSVGKMREGVTRPLVPELESLVRECRQAGVDAGLEIEGEPRPLEPQAELALRRAAQEALTNVRRHAKARSVRVRLAYAAESVSLSVSDDGQGSADPKKGFGLLGMRERVELLGGNFEVRTSPNAGFSVEISLSA